MGCSDLFSIELRYHTTCGLIGISYIYISEVLKGEKAIEPPQTGKSISIRVLVVHASGRGEAARA